jgi:hypothetical protein
MALATTVTGPGNQVSTESSVRKWRVISATGVITEYTETKTTVVTQWVAITKGAGDTCVAAEKAEGESRRCTEENRIVGSYVAESTVEIISTTKAEIED